MARAHEQWVVELLAGLSRREHDELLKLLAKLKQHAMEVGLMSPKHFRWRIEGEVGVITLNRPERKNPLTFESYAELRDFFGSLKNEKKVKAS